MRIGQKAPLFRGPAVCYEGMRYLKSFEFLGEWAILSFLPDHTLLPEQYLELWPAWVQRDARLILVQADDFPTIPASLLQNRWPRSVMLLDPLGRLRRRFGICRQTELKCRSFLIDPDWTIRLELVHDPSRLSAWWRNGYERELQERSISRSG